MHAHIYLYCMENVIIPVHVCVHTHACACMCVHVRMCACVHARVHVCVCMNLSLFHRHNTHNHTFVPLEVERENGHLKGVVLGVPIYWFQVVHYVVFDSEDCHRLHLPISYNNRNRMKENWYKKYNRACNIL